MLNGLLNCLLRFYVITNLVKSFFTFTTRNKSIIAVTHNYIRDYDILIPILLLMRTYLSTKNMWSQKNRPENSSKKWPELRKQKRTFLWHGKLRTERFKQKLNRKYKLRLSWGSTTG